MNRKHTNGFTLTELMVTMVIIGTLCGLLIATILGMRGKDAISNTAQMIYDDLITIRSRAVATARVHRIRFISDTSWVKEYYESTNSPPSWVQMGDIRHMPNDTNLIAGALDNAGGNLESTARGLFQFQNGASGTPYVSLEAKGSTQTKSIYVYTGGAIEIRTQ
ncbi:MAG: type II secretion system protein [Bdellovibrionales bacterium]|nr:type II secretion system protein [Bdellovibrionales bacterium]